MKKPWLILLGGLLAAGIGYACVSLPMVASHQTIEHGPHPEMTWLKEEYHLTDAQFGRVAELHAAYWPKCAEMCRRINEANARLQELLAATNTVTPEIKAALDETARVRTECQAAMLQHFYEVSRAMPPEEGKRYLSWVHEETLMPGQMLPTAPGDTRKH